MDKKIFFSYGHDEYKGFVLKVQKYLEDKEGFQVFVDSDKLRMGDDWEHNLEKAIEENNKMVFFITKHAARRPDGYCLNEISMALAHNKKVFPVMLEEHILPLSLIRKQYLDLRSCIFEDEECDDGIFEEQVKYLIEVLNSNSDLEHGDVQQKLIKRLKPIDFQSDYARHGRIIGREWVMDEVDDWLETQTKSKVLWITAEAGYGKSAISADLARHPKVMSVHFCNYNSPDTQDPRSVVKTLAYNLQAQQIEGYREEIQHIELEGKNAFELFRDLIANPLSKVKKEGSLYLFVIDALDETLNDENLELITLLGSDEFHWGLPDFVKIIMTSRPESKIKQAISKFNPLELEADRKENRDDCKKYIEVKLSELNKDNVENNDELVDVIMKNSSANMLYLTKFFEDDTLDLSQPDKFPKDLQEIYWRFFRRITKDIDEYDEKLSPILEVMLAYRESIPKLLLQDILGLPFITLKRRLSMFGSMLREDEGVLDFYHKSLRDWLVSENNEDYFVDKNEGVKKLQRFIEDLTKESYKEAYIDFEYFNTMLVDTIYEKEENLTKYFELISLIKDEKKKINLVNMIGRLNTVHNQISISVLLQEKIYKWVIKLYENNKEQWVDNYTLSLNNLGLLYQDIGRDNEAVSLLKEKLEIIKRLYQQNNEVWAHDYISSLNNLATVYKKIGNTHQALDLLKENLEILKLLYKVNKNSWARDYTLILNNLALVYEDVGQSSDALDLLKESLKIRKKFYNKDKYLWGEYYILALNNLASTYKNIGNSHESLRLEEESLEILKTLYEDDKDYWVSHYAITLSNLAMTYRNIGLYDKASVLGEESLDILKALYKMNGEYWALDYTTVLHNLAHTYEEISRSSDALVLLQDSYNIRKVFYQKNKESWADPYTSSLHSLTIANIKRKQNREALTLGKENVLILKALYLENKERWSKIYIESLNNLATVYVTMNRKDKAEVLMKEYRSLKKKHKNVNYITQQIAEKEPSWNDPCPCGSGKKYKKCCGKN